MRLARDHGMPLYSAHGEFLQPWAQWHLGEREGGLAAMRRGIAACHDMGNVIFTTLFETALAEAEAESGEIEAALASIDQAVALTERTGQRWNAIHLSCSDHNGHHGIYLVEWDGTKWTKASGWIEPIKDKVLPIRSVLTRRARRLTCRLAGSRTRHSNCFAFIERASQKPS